MKLVLKLFTILSFLTLPLLAIAEAEVYSHEIRSSSHDANSQNEVLNQLTNTLERIEKKVLMLEESGRSFNKSASYDAEALENKIKELEIKIDKLGKKLEPTTLSSTPTDNEKTKTTPENEENQFLAEQQHEETPKNIDEFNLAEERLMDIGDFATAEKIARNYLASHTTNADVAAANFWLGETYFGLKQYDQAAIHYVRSYKADNNGSHAPESLLKIAISLKNRNKYSEACTTLKKLKSQFGGKIDSTIEYSASDLSKSMQCGK